MFWKGSWEEGARMVQARHGKSRQQKLADFLALLQFEEEFDDQGVPIQVTSAGYCSSVEVVSESVDSRRFGSPVAQANRNLFEEYLGCHRSVRGQGSRRRSQMHTLSAHLSDRGYALVGDAQVSRKAGKVSHS